jgi:hypothetical protein
MVDRLDIRTPVFVQFWILVDVQYSTIPLTTLQFVQYVQFCKTHLDNRSFRLHHCSLLLTHKLTKSGKWCSRLVSGNIVQIQNTCQLSCVCLLLLPMSKIMVASSSRN